MSFSQRLKEARLAKGYTQQEVADQIGVAKGAVANYENSVSFPKIDILFKLFEVLEVDANYLYQDYVNFTDNSKLSDEEIDLIIDYRNITQNGKRMVRTVLNEELRRKDDEGCPPSKPVSMIVNTFF
jgi:transcriptional regulator with XRE-family HTH domain